MRKIEHDGKTVYLKERTIHDLLPRFNPRFAHKEKHIYHIKRPCALCEKYAVGESCDKCPLRVFETPVSFGDYKIVLAGCQCLIRNKLSISDNTLHIHKNSIWWLESNDSLARTQLQTIHNYIEKLPKVEKETTGIHTNKERKCTKP